MANPDSPSAPPLVFQQFRSENGDPLQSVQGHTIGRFGDLFIYWGDIQDTFSDVFYLLDNRGERVLFEVIETDDGYEL